VPYCTRLIIFHFSSHCSPFDFNVKSEDLDIILDLHARPDLRSSYRTSFGGGPRISISKLGRVLTSTHSKSDLQLDQPPSPSRSLPCQFSPTQYLNSRPGIDSITASTITESALPPVRAIRRTSPHRLCLSDTLACHAPIIASPFCAGQKGLRDTDHDCRLPICLAGPAYFHLHTTSWLLRYLSIKSSSTRGRFPVATLRL
jgi:hypothetical protein